MLGEMSVSDLWHKTYRPVARI